MTADPRAALATLVSALERHLEAAGQKRGENDPVVFAAYQDVAEAFDAYDDALLDAFDEVTPLEVYHEDSEEDARGRRGRPTPSEEATTSWMTTSSTSTSSTRSPATARATRAWTTRSTTRTPPAADPARRG